MKKLIVLCGLLGALAGMLGPQSAKAQISVEPIGDGGRPIGGCGGKSPQCFACTGLWCAWSCSGGSTCYSGSNSCYVRYICSTTGGSIAF